MVKRDEQRLQAILFDAYIGKSDEVEEELKACGIEPDEAEIEARDAHVFPKKQLTTEEFLAEMAAHKAKREAKAAAEAGNNAAAEVAADGVKPMGDAAVVDADEYKEVYVRKSVRSAASNPTGRKVFRRSLTAVATIAVVATAILGASVLFCEPVGADRDRTEHEGKYGDMHVISQGQMTDFVADNTFEVTTQIWEEVEQKKDILPELKVPGFVPEGYEFAKLKIQKEESLEEESQYEYLVQYAFSDISRNETFGILQQSLRDIESIKTFSEKEYDKIKVGEITMYIQYYQETDTYVVISFTEEEKITVTGNLTKLEAVEVIKNFK